MKHFFYTNNMAMQSLQTGFNNHLMRITALLLIVLLLLTSFNAAWAGASNVAQQDVSATTSNGVALPVGGPLNLPFLALDVANEVAGRPICPPMEDLGCSAEPTTPEEEKEARDAYASQNSCVFLQDVCKKDPTTDAPSSTTDDNLIMKLWNGVKNQVVEGYDFVKGVVLGLWQQLNDIWELVTNPLEVAEGLYQLGKALIFDTKNTIDSLGSLLSEGAQDMLTQASECGAYDKGYLIGSYVSPAIALKVFAKLAKVSKLSKYDGKVDKPIEDLKKEIGCNSFVAGTVIHTSEGNVAIEDIAVGTEVYSRDDENMRDGPEKVTHVFSHDAPGYYKLTAESETLFVTAEHPFWVQGKGWIKTQEIKAEDVISSRNGDKRVLANESVDKPVEVYNFTVHQTHSYFVGESGLWTHNACPSGVKVIGKIFVPDENGKIVIGTNNDYKLDAAKWLNAKGELKWINPITNKEEVFAVLDKVHVDHAYPQAKIKARKGFDLLTPEQQKALLNDTDNLEPMLGKANCSKGCKVETDGTTGWDTWTRDGVTEKIDPKYKKALEKKQKAMIKKVEDAIEARKKELGLL